MELQDDEKPLTVSTLRYSTLFFLTSLEVSIKMSHWILVHFCVCMCNAVCMNQYDKFFLTRYQSSRIWFKVEKNDLWEF